MLVSSGPLSPAWPSSQGSPIQLTTDPCTRDRCVGNEPDAVACKVIDHRKDAEPSTTSHGIGHKIEAPALVDTLLQRDRTSRSQRLFAAIPSPHLRPFLTKHPSELLVVHEHTFPAQKPVQTAEAEPALLCCHATHTLPDRRILTSSARIGHHRR